MGSGLIGVWGVCLFGPKQRRHRHNGTLEIEMQQNATKKREQAALLVAEDKLTDDEIAAVAGIERTTLHRWKQQTDFRIRVQQIVDEYRQKILTEGIADRINRVAALNDRWKRMQSVLEARAADPELQHIPGGKTGTLVKRLKMIGSGKEAEVVEEYGVDTALMAELRAHEQQAAKELGQWAEKHDVEVRDNSIAESVDRKLASLAAKLTTGSLSRQPESPGERGT